jgi:hypothetical protein
LIRRCAQADAPSVKIGKPDKFTFYLTLSPESLKMNRFLTASLVWRRRRGLGWAIGGRPCGGFGGEPAG